MPCGRLSYVLPVPAVARGQGITPRWVQQCGYFEFCCCCGGLPTNAVPVPAVACGQGISPRCAVQVAI